MYLKPEGDRRFMALRAQLFDNMDEISATAVVPRVIMPARILWMRI